MTALRQWLARQLRCLVVLIDVPPPNVFQDRVAVLVAQADALQSSGEYKRHTVYAQLRKEYPTMAHHAIGLAIEQAVTTCREGAHD